MTTQQWNQFMMDYGPFIWFIFLLILTIGVIVKSWPIISGLVHTVEIIQELPERLNAIEDRLKLVETEVTTNSGKSLKDAVKRIETKVYGEE